jgi:hypothetical protein
MRLADGAMRHHQVLTSAAVDYGPRSGNAYSDVAIGMREGGRNKMSEIGTPEAVALTAVRDYCRNERAFRHPRDAGVTKWRFVKSPGRRRNRN